MSIFVSDFFELNDTLDTTDTFDSILDEDSNFFINIIRLRSTQVPEFSKSYERINTYFSDIATLLQASDKKGDKFYRAALARFDFSEVNGINLGFSETKYGSGFGPRLRKQVIDDAFDIIKKGSSQPEIFHLVSLFEDNVGPDRLSDMIATIILPDIKEYTKRINRELNINPTTYPNVIFVDGIAQNPYKDCDILLLPIDILQELPIARGWDDIDRVMHENQSIRNEINEIVASEWSKWASSAKKEYIKRHIFEIPERCERVISGYKESTVAPVNLTADLDYFVAAVFKQIKQECAFSATTEPGITSFKATEDVITIFKNWVENNRGWQIILDTDSSKREKAVQRLFHLGAKHYITVNSLDISFEPDEGRGPADFKISRGADKTVGEIKLSSNAQYLHGYEVQVEEYALAEDTRNRCYILVDVGNPGRVKRLSDLHTQRQSSGENVPLLSIIDSKHKDSASTY